MLSEQIMRSIIALIFKVGVICFFLYLIEPTLLALDFSGQWRYGLASETENSINQIYSLNLYSTATEAISFGSTLRYTRMDQGSKTNELIIPTAYFILQNDLFNLNLSATDTERRSSEQPDISAYSYDANLITSLFRKKTNLRLYYGRASQHDDSFPRNIDTSSNQWGVGLNQRLYKMDLLYNYRGGDSKDKVHESETKSQNHFLKVQYFDSWKNFSWNLGQQLVYGKTDWQGKIQEGGYGLYKIPISVEWHPFKPGINTNSTDFNDYIEKVQNADYQDPNAGIVINLNYNSVDRIEFYYDSSSLIAIPAEVKWDIYWSNDKNTWTQIAESVSLPYEFSNTFSNGTYLKLIPRTTASSTLTVNNPEFKLYKHIYTTSYTQETTTYRTNISLAYTFNPNASISYFLVYDRTSSDSGFDIKRFTQGGSAYWYINQYFQPRINISKNTSSQSNQPDTSIQNFSLNILSEVLDTLTFSTAYIYSLSFQDDIKQTRMNTISFTSTSKLYPDLNLRWDFVYTNSYNYESDQSTNGFSSIINLIARIRPTLTLNTISSYNYSKTSGNDSVVNYSILINASWRLSQALFLRSTENVIWADNGDTNISSSYSLWIALTRATQLNFQYSNTRNTVHSDSFSGFLSWRISRYLSFRSNYSMTKTEDNSQWSCYFELMATF